MAPCVSCVVFVLLGWRGMVLISFSKDLSPIFSLRLQMALSLCPHAVADTFLISLSNHETPLK